MRNYLCTMEPDDLLAAALTPRPEKVEDGVLAMAPPEVRTALARTREAMSTLGRALAPEAPSASLKARILSTMKRQAPKRALLVVDMIVDHLAPGSTLEVPRARAIVPALKQRLDEARSAGIPVVYVLDEHDPDDPDLDAWGTHAVRGSDGAQVWDELAPQKGDRVVTKPSYSAFYESSLEPLLEELGIDTLVLTGCLTEIGLTATATDAMQRGFAVEIPRETQAGSAPEVEQVALITLNALSPFGPARKKRLERMREAA